MKHLITVENYYDFRAADMIKCPFCGLYSEDSTSVDRLGDGGSTEFSCDHCDKEFIVEARVLITYNVSIKPEDCEAMIGKVFCDACGVEDKKHK